MFACENAKRYTPQVTEASSSDEGMLYACLRHRFRTAADVLDCPGADLTQLAQAHRAGMFGAIWIPYMVSLVGCAMRGLKPALHSGLPQIPQALDEDFTAVGKYILRRPEPPLGIDLLRDPLRAGRAVQQETLRSARDV